MRFSAYRFSSTIFLSVFSATTPTSIKSKSLSRRFPIRMSKEPSWAAPYQMTMAHKAAPIPEVATAGFPMMGRNVSGSVKKSIR